jgi:hypothetical protein
VTGYSPGGRGDIIAGGDKPRPNTAPALPCILGRPDDLSHGDKILVLQEKIQQIEQQIQELACIKGYVEEKLLKLLHSVEEMGELRTRCRSCAGVRLGDKQNLCALCVLCGSNARLCVFAPLRFRSETG